MTGGEGGGKWFLEGVGRATWAAVIIVISHRDDFLLELNKTTACFTKSP